MNASPSDGPIEAEWTIESGERLLRLVLFRAGDRYAHRIELTNAAGEPIASAVSREGGPPDEQLDRSIDAAQIESEGDDWPLSPPFQQFHPQEVDGRRIWFLVGMAGKSHWSATIVALDDGSGWEFDVACRYRSEKRRLGSSYTMQGCTSTPPIVPVAEDWRTFFFTVGDCASAIPANQLSPPPATARWRYGWKADAGELVGFAMNELRR